MLISLFLSYHQRYLVVITNIHFMDLVRLL